MSDFYCNICKGRSKHQYKIYMCSYHLGAQYQYNWPLQLWNLSSMITQINQNKNFPNLASFVSSNHRGFPCRAFVAVAVVPGLKIWSVCCLGLKNLIRFYSGTERFDQIVIWAWTIWSDCTLGLRDLIRLLSGPENLIRFYSGPENLIRFFSGTEQFDQIVIWAERFDHNHDHWDTDTPSSIIWSSW